MNATLSKRELLHSLLHLERVVPVRSVSPGLSLVRVEFGPNKLALAGSNMDIDIYATVAAEVSGEGELALPAHVFGQVVKGLPAETLELELDDTELSLRSGAFETRLQLAELSSSPKLEFAHDYPGTLPATGLVEALEHVRYAAAVAEYQAVFRGVKLELADGWTRAVATDGFRLAYYHLDESSGLEGDIVIPGRCVDELIRILDGGDAGLNLVAGQLCVACEGYRLNVKLMEGTFPDYSKIIPTAFPVSVTVDAALLSEAVSRVAVLADKTANNRVDLFIKDGTLQITAEGGYGHSKEQIDIQQEGSDPEIALAYNAKYLVDALTPVQGKVRVSFSGMSTPSVIASLEEPSYLAMVVPLKIG